MAGLPARRPARHGEGDGGGGAAARDPRSAAGVVRHGSVMATVGQRWPSPRDQQAGQAEQRHGPAARPTGRGAA